MNNYIKAISKINFSEQTKIRLGEIIGIENYFYQEINERKSYIKKLNKYITIFEYIDKILIILSATSGGVSIISFTTIVGVPVGIASASFTLIFSIAKGIIKILLKITRNKKKMVILVVLSKCAICNSKKSRFIKEQEAKRIIK